jgi:hypothetical protein
VVICECIHSRAIMSTLADAADIQADIVVDGG